MAADLTPESKLDLVCAFQQELCKHLQLALPFPIGARGSAEVEGWIAAVDAGCEVHQLRHYLLTHTVHSATLAALASRLITAPHPSDTDRTKIDLLLVHYLAQTISAEQSNLTLVASAELLQPVLGLTTPDPAPALMNLATELETAATLRDLIGRKVLERLQKARAEQHDYTRASMALFAWIGLRARRSCVRLLHRDIDCIEHNLARLQQLGITQLPVPEKATKQDRSIGELLNKCRSWRRPFTDKYRDESWLTQVADLCAITEDNLKRMLGPIAHPASVHTTVEKSSEPKRDEPAQDEEKLLPLQCLIDEIRHGLQGVRSGDFARVQIGPMAVILSSAEIRAFRSETGTSSSLFKNMVASRALLQRAAKSSEHVQLETARNIAADLLVKAEGVITTAEQSQDSELGIDLRGSARSLEKALARSQA